MKIMWITGVVVPIIMAAINIPYWPYHPNIFATGMCLGLAVGGLLKVLIK